MSGFGDALMVPALEQHHSPAAWAAVNTPGLDAISATPLAAFSATRRLRTAYTGPCMRIRRTDNAELDVGFGADNLLDAAAIATFCAGSTGYVKTWYDQSGHGNDVTQSVTTKQPIIYASGAITVNSAGKAAFHLDGVDDYMGRADALGLTGSPALTVGSVIQSASADAWGWGFGGTAANASWDFELYKGGSNLAITQTSGGFRNFNWAWQTGVHQYICGKAAAATSGSWTCEQDGIALSQQSAHGAPSALNLANSVFNIGTGATVGQSGVWGEEYTNFIVVYNAVLAGADSVALRNEQAQHSIPGPGDLIAIADQRSWFRADSGVTSASNRVSAWADVFGNGNLAQATGGSQPLLVAVSVGGQPGVSDDDGNRFMKATLTTPVAIGQRAYVWIMLKVASLAATAQYTGGLGGVGSNRALIAVEAANKWRKFVQSGTASDTAASTITADTTTFHLLETGMTTGGFAGLVVSGVAVDLAAEPGPILASQNVATIFASSGSVGGTGMSSSVAEMIIMAAEPAPAVKTAMRAYFAARYGSI